MAVISTTKEDVAFLRGLYATLSITIPKTVQITIEMSVAKSGDNPAFVMESKAT